MLRKVRAAEVRGLAGGSARSLLGVVVQCSSAGVAVGSAPAFVYLRAHAAVVSEATVWVKAPGRVGSMPACRRPRALRGPERARSSGALREATRWGEVCGPQRQVQLDQRAEC